MKSVLTVMSASIVALTLPVLASAQVTTDSRLAEPAITAQAPRIEAQQASAARATTAQTLEQQSCANPWRPEEGSDYYWRWRAYHNLDCAMAVVDEHLRTRVNGEDGTVPVSREELER